MPCLSHCFFFPRSLKNDLFTLSDGVDGLAEWRLKESQELGQIVQNRLEYLQVGRGRVLVGAGCWKGQG